MTTTAVRRVLAGNRAGELRRGDLALWDAGTLGLVPVKVLSVRTVRERFGDPYRAAVLRTTAARPGYVRGEAFMVPVSSPMLVLRRTRVAGGNVLVRSPLRVVADSELTCDRCGGTARRFANRAGEYSVTHMRTPCDDSWRLSTSDIRALDTLLLAWQGNGADVTS